MLWLEVRRLRRRPLLVLAVVLSALAPSVVMIFAGSSAAMAVAAVVLVLAGRALSGGVAAWAGSSGLRRLVPADITTVRLVMLLPAAVVLAAWGVVAVGVGGFSGWFAPAFVLAGLCALLRDAEPVPPPTFSILVPTHAGVVPFDFLATLSRGFVEASVCLFVVPMAPTLAPLVGLVCLLATSRRASWV